MTPQFTGGVGAFASVASRRRSPRDSFPRAEYRLAGETTDVDELTTLATHPNPKVRKQVGYNQRTPQLVRMQMLRESSEQEVIASVLRYLDPQPWPIIRDLLEANHALVHNRSMYYELCRMVRSGTIPATDVAELLLREPGDTQNGGQGNVWTGLLNDLTWHRFVTRPGRKQVVNVRTHGGLPRHHLNDTGPDCDPRLPEGVLCDLFQRYQVSTSTVGDVYVRMNIATIGNAPDSVQILASEDPDLDVRKCLTIQPNLCLEAVENLARGRSAAIRDALLGRHRDRVVEIRDDAVLAKMCAVAPRSFHIGGLVHHPSPVVRAGLAKNAVVLRAHPDVTRVLVEDADPRVRQNVALHAPWPFAALLVDDEDPKVRGAVAKHSQVTAEVLSVLAHDGDGRVSRAASSRLLKTLA